MEEDINYIQYLRALDIRLQSTRIGKVHIHFSKIREGFMEWVKFGRDLEGERKCEEERADGRKIPLEEIPKAQKFQDISQQ